MTLEIRFLQIVFSLSTFTPLFYFSKIKAWKFETSGQYAEHYKILSALKKFTLTFEIFLSYFASHRTIEVMVGRIIFICFFFFALN